MVNVKKYNKLIFVTIFAIGFALIESAVVVYLRELYFPEGFGFPLKFFKPSLYIVEILREIATIIVLAAVAHLSGINFYSRFAYFLISFGVWDIFYYVWLKIFLNWPESFLTWDVLFLIPITWIGPVLAPILCSILMIKIGVLIIELQSRNYRVKLKIYEWLLLFTGSLIIFITFTYDYASLIIKNNLLTRLSEIRYNPELQEIFLSFAPNRFSWEYFILGYILLVLATISFGFNSLKEK